MKFDLTGENTAATAGTAPESAADGTFVVMPEAVLAILNEVQTTAAGFGQLFTDTEDNMIDLAEACKAPPITTELSTYSTFMLKWSIRGAAGRITVAVDAVAAAVLALVQGDEQMSDSAREAAALAYDGGASSDLIVGIRPSSATRQDPTTGSEHEYGLTHEAALQHALSNQRVLERFIRDSRCARHHILTRSLIILMQR